MGGLILYNFGNKHIKTATEKQWLKICIQL